MPPIRFLHAAGLDPDAVLPRFPSSPHDLFDAAPLTVIERLVDQAVAHEVDFLLVSSLVGEGPNQLPPSFHSLVALRRVFSRLMSAEIPVFLAVAGDRSTWEPLVDRGSTLAILAPGASVPIVDRQRNTQISLRCVDKLSGPDAPSAVAQTESCDVLVAPTLAVEDVVNDSSFHQRYLGCGVGPRRSMPVASGLAHSPGVLQSTTYSDAGPHGATLVTIDGSHEVRTEFVPLAPVRYESLAARAKAGESLDDLAMRLSERLSEQRSEAGELVWNVRWSIEAGGELFEALSDPVQRGLFVSLLPDSVGEVPIVHRMTLVPHPLWPAVEEPFAAEFAAALVDQESDLSDLTSRDAFLKRPSEAHHRQQFEQLLADTDTAAVMAQARRLGLRVVAAARADDDVS